MNDAERVLCVTCAARLDGQLELGYFALALTAVGLYAGVQFAGLAWCAVGLVGLAERYVAVRIAVDARLFRQLSAAPLTLLQLDAAMVELGLLQNAKADRPLSSRISGAQHWLHRHTLLVVVQAVLIFVLLATRIWRLMK